MSKLVNFRFSEEFIAEIDAAHVDMITATKVAISKSEFIRMCIKKGMVELKEVFQPEESK